MMFVYSLRPQFFGEHQTRLRHDRRHREAVRKRLISSGAGCVVGVGSVR